MLMFLVLSVYINLILIIRQLQIFCTFPVDLYIFFNSALIFFIFLSNMECNFVYGPGLTYLSSYVNKSQFLWLDLV